jgi:sporulation integral membrane protein YtvI
MQAPFHYYNELGGDDMKLGEDSSQKRRSLILMVGITIGVYLGFKYLLPLILPFLFAYFLAWIVRPVTESLYRKFKIPRILGGSASLLLLIAVFGTSICLLINILVKQAIAFIRNMPIYLDIIASKLDKICSHCDKLFGLDGGTMRATMDDNILQMVNRVKTQVIPEITQHTISITIRVIGVIGILLIVFVAAVLIVKDLPDFHKKYEKNSLYHDIHRVTQKLSEAGLAYLRSQLIIMITIAGICILGLSLTKNEYAALAGIGIAIMDALPVLGSGIILVPWAIIMLIAGDIYSAAIIITTFLACQILREILEPKLIGNRIGIKPLFTLVAMYVGLKLFSIAGFILGPIGLIIIQTVYKAVNEREEKTAGKEEILVKSKTE